MQNSSNSPNFSRVNKEVFLRGTGTGNVIAYKLLDGRRLEFIAIKFCKAKFFFPILRSFIALKVENLNLKKQKINKVMKKKGVNE